MVVSETADQKFIREIKPRELSDLPAGELLIEVKYSSLNYKEFPPTRREVHERSSPKFKERSRNGFMVASVLVANVIRNTPFTEPKQRANIETDRLCPVSS